jgi:HAD superfamily hydrolase (TIGR01509 family)
MHEQLGLKMEPDAISAAVVELMAARYRDRLPLIEGAEEAVRRLSARWPLGLASASNRAIIDLVMQLAGWVDLFAVTVSAEEVDHGKPQPDVYLEAVRRLGEAAGQCVAIEDSSAGIRSASAAGLGVVAIPNRAFPPDSRALGLADAVLESISELGAEQILQAASR